MRTTDVFGILKQTAVDWAKDKGPTLGAALAYYAIFSMGPLLIIVTAIAGIAFGEQAARGQIVEQMRGLLGDRGAEAIQAVIQGASKPSHGILAAAIGGVTLIITASGALGQLQTSLNAIWKVETKRSHGVWSIIRRRLLSIGAILVAGFLLLASILISTAFSVAGHWLGATANAQIFDHLWNLAVSFVIITLLFAMIFKFLPEVTISWGDVWMGALFTAVLFTGGNYLVGLYLAKSVFASTYGAAGSLLVLLLWAYYSAQILFFGAEFTKVYAERYGSHLTRT